MKVLTERYREISRQIFKQRSEQVVLILFYNAVFAGLGRYIIGNFFNTQYNSIAVLLILFCLVVFDSFISKKKFAAYGIKLLNKENLKLAVMVFAIFFPIAIASRIFFPSFDIVYAKALELDYSSYVRFLLFLVPLGILTEEIGTRALFQSKLSSAFGSRFALYATIVNFALLHSGWAFSMNLTNFLIIMSTVFAYSIFLALLFDYTKNIFSTIVVHLLVNVVSAFQILFHIFNQLTYETVLWSVWGMLFIILFPQAVSLLRKAFALSRGERKIKGFSEKTLLVIMSIFSLLVIILVNSFL